MLAWARALASIWTYRFATPRGNDFGSTTTAEWTKRALAFPPLPALGPSAGHTCHLNACDRDGTVVALTFTHGQFQFGGRWAVRDTGVIMNAGMHLLTAADPVTADGRLYAVTNMSPAVARLPDGGVVAAGCPGARRIPTSVGLVLARHLYGGLGLQDAVSCGRFHAETATVASIEMSRWTPSVVDALRLGFATVEDEQPRGALSAIRREAHGTLSVGLDDRISQGYAAELASAA